MTANANPESGSPFSFPDWAQRMRLEESLTPGLREGYRQKVARFEPFCGQRQARPPVAGAREFVALARLEGGPSPARLQEWKDALSWYSRRGREGAAVALKGVPPLARTDWGTAAWEAAWEAALIARLQQEQRSWRTEQTYQGWVWRFARWLRRQDGEKRHLTLPPSPRSRRSGRAARSSHPLWRRRAGRRCGRF